MRASWFRSIVVAVFGPLLVIACAQGEAPGFAAKASADIVIIEFGESRRRFNIEFADTDEKRRVGLMYRSELAEDAGMLFDFGDPQPVSMWMKNTLLPLDMAFIDQHGVIKRIAAQTTPRSLESIPSGSPVIAVLEVNGGTFERLGIEEGAVVRHPLFEPKTP